MHKNAAWLILLLSLFIAGCSRPAGETPLAASAEDATLQADFVATLTSFPLEPSPSVQPESTALPAGLQQSVDLPPAGVPSAVPTDGSIPEGSSCHDGLKFVADLTIPDGSQLGRGSQVDKRWQVQNIGTCNWDSRYKLVQVLGPDMGLPKEQALYPARRGAAAVIRMLLTTPLEPGVYTCAWQAMSPSGEMFGDVIYIEFQVN